MTKRPSRLAGKRSGNREAKPPRPADAAPAKATVTRGSAPTGKSSGRRSAANADPAPATLPPPPIALPLSVVGIGASAGGLDAFLRLIKSLPRDTGLAYVLVQHLDPTHESLLPGLLERAAAIPVTEAADGMRVDPDHAYVIPPNTTITITDGHLRVSARRKEHGAHLPIDALLSSLAVAYASGAVGVVLSGAGFDGTRGIERIKEAGGITMAQDSASAGFPSMPESAASTGAVDFILGPEEIAAQLTRLGRHLAQHPSEAAPIEATSADEADLREILQLLHQRRGVDFQHYRRGTVHRRILKRMLSLRQDTRPEYLAYLRDNPTELDALYEGLLIGVTNFFRDPEVFAALRHTGFPALKHTHAGPTALRVWVPGCASGEEAYSIAIALLEFLDDSGMDVPIQVFGTDLDEASIAKARAGRYPENISDHVSPERLRRFFVAEDGGYRVTKAVRDLCIFSRHNVVRDPPFTHLDLISCRNVLIYFDSILQRRVFPVFHYALEPAGLLLLGTAESASIALEFFAPLVKRSKIYRRRAGTARSFGRDSAVPMIAPATGVSRYPLRPLAISPEPGHVEAEAYRTMLAQLAPAIVVVNVHLEMLHIFGATVGFLALSAGAASLNLLKVARPELVRPIRAAVRRAIEEGRPVREIGIALTNGDTVRHVAIDVLPFRSGSEGERYFVVLFRDEQRPGASVADAEDNSAPGSRRRGRARGGAGEVRALRAELAAATRYLQDTVEEDQATAEELRAANEEIQSSNEELQSTNEELETTKEEVQATNEELTTVNEELRHRNQELAALSSDLANVLASTTIPIFIVDRNLRLRRFTPTAPRVMNVIVTDVGRPLGDVTLRVAISDLETKVMSAIETLTVTEQEVQDENGRWWALTIRPYQSTDGRVDGAVLVFADVDASKRYAEQAQKDMEARQELLDASELARGLADEARQIAEVANSTKSTFLASMSHDLRTPLNAITGYTELLELGIRGPVTEAQLADFARIRRSARYLLALINDILNFAKLQAGQIDYRLADVSLVGLAAELQELIAPQLAAKSLHFERAESDMAVNADPEKLRQILLNLLSNALKFTEPGGRMGIDWVSSEDRVRIRVWDTGRGIPSEAIERIFEPFVQVDHGLGSPPRDGVGLGLAISRDLARAMGGDLVVESAPRQGSRFTLTLPRAGDPG